MSGSDQIMFRHCFEPSAADNLVVHTGKPGNEILGPATPWSLIDLMYLLTEQGAQVYKGTGTILVRVQVEWRCAQVMTNGQQYLSRLVHHVPIGGPYLQLACVSDPQAAADQIICQLTTKLPTRPDRGDTRPPVPRPNDPLSHTDLSVLRRVLQGLRGL